MNLTTNPKVWKFMLVIFVLLTASFVVMFYFQNIFLIFIFGIILIILTEKTRDIFNKVMDKFSSPKWVRRVTTFLLIAIILSLSALLINDQIKDVADLVRNEQDNQNVSENIFAKIQSYIPEISGEKLITESDFAYLGNQIFSIISDFLQQLSFFIFTGIIIVPLMFRMYYTRREKYISFITSNVPKKFSAGFRRAIEEIGEKLESYLTAKIIESLIVGAIGCIGFYIVGVRGWFFLGIITGIFNVAPYIGPFIGAIPPMLTGYLDSPQTALFALITVLVAQAVDNFYLQPFMIPGKVKLDSLLSISLLLISAKLFGITGMIFALPIFIIYRIILRESYEELVKIFPEKQVKANS